MKTVATGFIRRKETKSLRVIIELSDQNEIQIIHGNIV